MPALKLRGPRLRNCLTLQIGAWPIKSEARNRIRFIRSSGSRETRYFSRSFLFRFTCFRSIFSYELDDVERESERELRSVAMEIFSEGSSRQEFLSEKQKKHVLSCFPSVIIPQRLSVNIDSGARAHNLAAPDRPRGFPRFAFIKRLSRVCRSNATTKSHRR